MPESEPKPKLIELVAPGAGQGWKAVLRNGKAAVVHEIPVPPAEAQAAVPRLQRLYEHRHPALSPVLAWGTDQQGVWVAVEPNEGTPLGTILSRGALTPPAAAALGAAVLSGVAALHEAGIAMGGFGAAAVRVTSNGEVRLAGHPAAAVRGAPSQSDLRADVRSSGMAVCAAFGVDPAGAPAPANIPPGLVVTMRSMASGAMGPSADRAQGALREMAAPLLAPDRQMAAQSELATRSSGREVPKVTPFLPQDQKPAEPVEPATAPAAPVTAPYTPPVRREETPVRQSVSYDAPDRPIQTYPAIPAVTYPPAPAAPAASAPPAPVVPVEPRTSEPAVPTWSQAPPRREAPFEPAAAPEPAIESNPPAPAAPAPAAPTPPAPPVPAWEPAAPAATAPTPPAPPVPTWEPAAPAASAPTPKAPPVPTWEPAPEPAKPASPFDNLATPLPAPPLATNPPVPAAPAPAPTFATNPPAPAPAAPAAPPAPSKQTWSPVEAPVWTPGEAVPAEALGAGAATAESAPAPAAPAPSVTAEPEAPVRPPTAPVRRPTVPRPPRGGGVTFERPPWLVPAAVAAVIVILLGVFGVIILSHRGPSSGNHVAQTSPTARASTTPKSSPTATPSSKGQPQAVPTFAPASADPISKVMICSTATPCNLPGAPAETATACDLTSCHIEVALYFTTNQKSVAYGYIIKFFDRCSGQTTDLPGPNASTPASGYIVAIPSDHWTVNIPSGVKSGAIVAVAQQPAVAASAPLLLGANSCA